MAAARRPHPDRLRRAERRWRDRIAALVQPQRSPVMRLLDDQPLTVDDVLARTERKSIFRGRSSAGDGSTPAGHSAGSDGTTGPEGPPTDPIDRPGSRRRES